MAFRGRLFSQLRTMRVRVQAERSNPASVGRVKLDAEAILKSPGIKWDAAFE
ncbi:MAG: hypothetical protein ACREQI_15190 [Candidatus Binataceae bacterium]